MRVHAGARSGAAEVNVTQVLRRRIDASAVAPDGPCVCCELLPEADRHGVLEVRARGLQHAVEFLALVFERRGERFERFEELWR